MNFNKSAGNTLTRLRRHLPPALVMLAYILAAHWQLVANINRGFFGRPFEDAISVIWQYWWGAQVLLGKTSSMLYSPDVYFPHGYNLAADAQPVWWMILLSPITSFLGPLLTYNLTLLVVLFIAAIGMYLLVERLTDQRWPGVVAGAIYISAPMVTLRLAGHLNLLLCLAWLPFMALFWYRALNAASNRTYLYSGLAGLFFGLATLSSYYFVFVAFLVIVSMFLFPPCQITIGTRLKRGTPLLITWLAISLPFVFLTIAANNDLYGETLSFSVASSDIFSISLYRLFIPNPLNPLWRESISAAFPLGSEETFISLDYLAIILAIVGCTRIKGRFRFAFGFLFVVSVLLAMGTTLHWADQRVSLELPGVVGEWYKSLTGWLTAEISEDPVIPLPGLLLARVVPFYSGMRAWPRFLFTAVFSLAVLAGYGLSYIMSNFKRGWLVIPVGLVAVFINGLVVPYTNFTETASLERPVDAWLEWQEPGSAIVEYPWLGRSKLALYGQTIHDQPIVNGYAPLQPQFLSENPAVTENWPIQEGIDVLSAWGVRYLLLTRSNNKPGQDEILSQTEHFDGLCLVKSFPEDVEKRENQTYVFEILGQAGACPD